MRWKWARPVFILVAVTAIGGFVYAAGSTVSFEAEDGLLNGLVAVASVPNSSNDSAIQFNSAAAKNISGAGGGNSNTCIFSVVVTQAFCESFDTPYNGTKTQTGDLNPVLWGVSRDGELDTPNYVTNSHNACSHGGTTGNSFLGDPTSTYFGPMTPAPGDARICNGQYVESMNDGGSVTAITSYPKQPFDFTDRTGRVVFDVSNDGSGNHGAWPEFMITDEPVPGIRTCNSQCPGGDAWDEVTATNMVGFSMESGPEGTPPWGDQIGVGEIVYSRDGSNQTVFGNNYSKGYNSITKGCLAGHSYSCSVTKMNHYEVQVSKTRIDVWATDAFSGTLDLKKTPLKHVQGADINLNFSTGLVWMNDMHYNARKAIEGETSAHCAGCGTQYDHSFAWDNLGFDGQKTYRDLGFDVALAHVAISGDSNQAGESGTEYAEGYTMNGSKSFTIPDVSWEQTPKRAKVVLNAMGVSSRTLKVVLNGHTVDAVTKPVPDYNKNFWGTLSFTFPAVDAVQGPNKIDITSTDGNGTIYLANISLIMVAGAPVP